MTTHVRINQEEKETNASNLLQLTKELALPDRGVAIAINNKIVPKHSWQDTILHDCDEITIIKAAFGG